jgi:hypothetical protein
MRRLLFALLLILSVAPLQARADMAKFEAALALFNEAALWRDSGQPAGGGVFPTGGVARFASELRVHIGGSATSSLRAAVAREMRLAADIVLLGGQFVDSADKANLKFVFQQQYMDGGFSCNTNLKGTNGVITEATIRIGSDSVGCIAHEILHALGLLGHPHDHDTILSYTRHPARSGNSGMAIASFTELDKLVLRTLYRANIKPGTYHLPALVAARDYLAAELGLVATGVSAEHLARPFMDAQVARLRGVAEPYIQTQLGNAYWLGHYVAVDHAKALSFWHLAAEKNNAEAIFWIGIALRTGKGIAADAAAARVQMRTASEFGSAIGAAILGEMLRDGEGGAADPVEAFAYFDLAHRRGEAQATARRDQLADSFDAATKACAAARAAELPTEPRPAQ